MHLNFTPKKGGRSNRTSSSLGGIQRYKTKIVIRSGFTAYTKIYPIGPAVKNMVFDLSVVVQENLVEERERLPMKNISV